MGQRRKARELALQCLYELEEAGKDPGEVLRSNAERRDSSRDSAEYAGRLVAWVLDETESLDKAIAAHLQNWDIARVSLVLRVIMRLSLAEGRHAPELSVGIILNESVELARKYDGDKGASFVNGVLEGLINAARDTGEA